MLAESIRGKSVIVTGASKGIGKGIARVFARHGAKVMVVGRDLASAEAAAGELVDRGYTASGFSADVTRLEDMQAMAEAAVDRHGGVDVLCANAGMFPQVTIENMSAEMWDDVQATNLKGTFLVGEGLHTLSQEDRRGTHRHHLVDHRARSPASPAGATMARPRRANSASCAPPAWNWRNTASPSTPSCPAIS